jgi:hypothetical protein
VYDTEFRLAVPGTAPGADTAALVGRLGTLQIGVGYGSTPSVARRNQIVREFFPYRVTGTSFEVLLPSRTNRAKLQSETGSRKWFPETAVRELDVTFASTPPGP